MKINSFNIRKLCAPLIYPFRTALGQHDSLENVIFSIKLENGIEGFGEAGIAPHITEETVSTTIRNLKKIGAQLIGQDVRQVAKISRCVREQLPQNWAALAAVEMAVLDALTKSRGIPLWRLFAPTKAAGRTIATDITIVISSLAETEAAARTFYRQDFRAFKVKIGRDSELDLKRVLAVKRLAPRRAIYLDANQGYSAKQTIEFLQELRRLGVRPQLVEQPVRKDDWEGLRQVTAARLAPVCADESVYSIKDCRRIIRDKAADVINIKLMKSGFIEGQRIATLAKRNGLKLMLGAMMESNLAITAAAHLAAGLGIFDFIDLDPPFFIRGGVEANPYLNSRGVYDLRQVKSGIGIQPND